MKIPLGSTDGVLFLVAFGAIEFLLLLRQGARVLYNRKGDVFRYIRSTEELRVSTLKGTDY